MYKKKKNNIDKSKLLEERRLRQELWETDHLWHVREFGRHMKALKKEQKKLNKHD